MDRAKCLADASLHVPLDEIKVDKTLRFVEEFVEIMDREVKRLKHSKISFVKVRGFKAWSELTGIAEVCEDFVGFLWEAKASGIGFKVSLRDAVTREDDKLVPLLELVD
ncbi:hypothetical protein Tco_0058330 [Tanacetum coccineum]